MDLYQLAADSEPKPAKQPLPMLASAMLCFTLVWFVIAVPNMTDAGIGFFGVCLLLPLTVIVIATWFLTLVKIADASDKSDRQTIKAWRFCTGLILFTALLAWPEVGFRARLWLSSGSLEKYAISLPNDSHSLHPQGYVGLFLIEGYQKDSNGVVAIWTTSSGFLDRAGLLYVPPNAPIPEYFPIREHFFGSWYWCLQRF